jgi:lipoate synthase
MKCSVEIFETNSEAPMANQPTLRPARKYSTELRPLRAKYTPMPKMMTK